MQIRSRKAEVAGVALACFLLSATALPLLAREKDKLHYGEGLIVNIPLPEAEVEQVVEDVAQNGVIRGTKEYNKDEFVGGAKAVSSTRVFPSWTEGGKVFYKIREQAIDPRNFKDSGDSGTLAVRYVVMAQGDKNTVLRIDAAFEEDFRRIVHPSSGSVESDEYKDIQQHLEAIEVMKQQNEESEKERGEERAKRKNVHRNAEAIPFVQEAQDQSDARTQIAAVPRATEASASPGSTSPGSTSSDPPSPGSTPATPPPPPAQSLEEHVKDLRKQVERLVKSPGAPLKSAPFHTASTLQTLTAGTEVLILISTPYWYGVETHEGQHGWMLRDQLEQP